MPTRPAGRTSRVLALGAATILALAAGITILATTGAHKRAHRRTASPASAVANHSSWSVPATLTACSGTAAPEVLFPQETPFRLTGPGAIVLQGAHSCALPSGAAIAAIGSEDAPGKPRRPPGAAGDAIAIGGPLAAAATTKGQIALIGAAPPSAHASARSRTREGAEEARPGAQALLSEGAADGSFAQPQPLPGAAGPVAVTSAYLGDVAIASRGPSPRGSVQLRLQGHLDESFSPPVSLGGAAGGERPLAVALDYRADAMVLWWQHGWLYARERHTNGPLGALQRFARAPSDVQATMLISDDGRAIVAWLDPGARTARLYLDISAPGMRLGPGRVIERLRWSGGPLPPNAAVRLVRLSTESVLMAWTGTAGGRFLVRAAGIDLQGVRTEATVSGAGQDALLQGLATGPRGDAVALWSSFVPARGAPRLTRPAILAAWGVPSSRGVARFGPPHLLARRSATGMAVAIDPRTDRAVASWREASGAIRYAIGHATRPL